MFPRNTWYVAATSAELTDKPLARQICGQKIAFYRDGEGRVAAVEDFCPHRGAPLSLGFIEDGKLVCGYHGLKMGSDGKTESMPKQRVQGFPCIHTYPVEERGGFIWIWPGDPALAKKEDIPEFIWNKDPAWSFGGSLYHIQCDYRLMIDNLMDLTHETYVHATSIGQKEIDEAPVSTKVEGDRVITSRFMENAMPPPFWQSALKANGLAHDVPVDRWQICQFTPPSHVMIEVGVAHAGKGGLNADAAHKVNAIVVDFITPETETSMWYFWGFARAFKPQDKALTDRIREGQGNIFAEDLEMLEQQQKNLQLHFSNKKLLKLDIDAGGVQARRIIDRMLKKEQAEETPDVTPIQARG
jgi:vanillate O-demethylase monooxygenase subunit